MNDTSSFVEDIVGIEWNLFRAVPSIGGTASCQQDARTFRIMRSSQLASWSPAALESYLGDLRDAEPSGRNLLTEKYARMMQSTSPAEYARIEHMLPAVGDRARELIERIVPIVLEWEVELAARFPNVMKRGRPVFRTEDRFGVTSLETYLRGELATYSTRTLDLYLANVIQQRDGGVNGAEVVLLHTVQQYGFDTPRDADEGLARRT